MTREQQWKRQFAQLAHSRKHGEYPPPAVGKWLRTQRELASRGALAPARKRRLEALGESLRPRPSFDERWERQFRKLAQFRARYGHTRVPVGWKADPAFGLWVASQRSRLRAGRLRSDRRRRLISLGITGDPGGEYFEERFAELLQFKKRFGHWKVLRTTPGYEKLGIWVHGVRDRKANGRLRPEHRRRLDSVHFPWKAVRSLRYDQQWVQRFAELRRALRRHSFLELTHRHRLGSWINSQRKAGHRGDLRPERRRKLESVGFLWDKRDALWEADLRRLLAHRRRKGDLTDLGIADRNWITRQRRLWRDGRLPPRRERRIRAEGIWLERPRPRDEDLLEELRQFKRERGHLAVPNVPAHHRLWAWTELQRQQAAKGRLDRRLRRELDRLGFPWSADEVEWERAFSRVADLHRRTGRARPSAESAMGQWIAEQRRLHLEGDLPLDAEARLSRLGLLRP